MTTNNKLGKWIVCSAALGSFTAGSLMVVGLMHANEARARARTRCSVRRPVASMGIRSRRSHIESAWTLTAECCSHRFAAGRTPGVRILAG